jgi:hypothetical protein
MEVATAMPNAPPLRNPRFFPRATGVIKNIV